QFPEVEPVGDEMPSMHLELEDLHRVSLSLSADLGRAQMTVREILDLKVGSIVSLDTMAGEMTDVRLDGLPIARGEVVVIGDVLHVRLSEITGISEIQGI
ncbi:FliM/FliN family flagellar motor switch protein, partial [bacterium AH-315-P07]|nr:FliM/FliN family flagellar motor switch protein [bacterium AH-315-P07]